MACLTQRIVKGNLVQVTTSEPQRLTSKGLAESILIELDVDPVSVGPLFTGVAHTGYRYPDRINDWFSAAIETPVILIHSSHDKSRWK